MITAIVAIWPENAHYWPETGMTHRMIVSRSSFDAIIRASRILANGKPCRIEAYQSDKFYVKCPDIVTYLNDGTPD